MPKVTLWDSGRNRIESKCVWLKHLFLLWFKLSLSRITVYSDEGKGHFHRWISWASTKRIQKKPLKHAPLLFWPPVPKCQWLTSWLSWNSSLVMQATTPGPGHIHTTTMFIHMERAFPQVDAWVVTATQRDKESLGRHPETKKSRWPF